MAYNFFLHYYPWIKCKWWWKSKGNKGNHPQIKELLVIKQILVSTIGNVERKCGGYIYIYIYIYILGNTCDTLRRKSRLLMANKVQKSKHVVWVWMCCEFDIQQTQVCYTPLDPCSSNISQDWHLITWLLLDQQTDTFCAKGYDDSYPNLNDQNTPPSLGVYKTPSKHFNVDKNLWQTTLQWISN